MLTAEQIADPRQVFLAVAELEHTSEALADGGIFLVQADHNIVVDKRIGDSVLLLGQLTEQKVRVGLVGLDLKHTPKLLARLGIAVHVHQQLAKIEQGIKIARIRSQLLQVELASTLQPPGGGVRGSKPCTHPRELRIEPRGLTQTPDRTLGVVGLHERLGNRRVELAVFRVDLLTEVEDLLGFLVAIEIDQRLDPVYEDRDVHRFELEGLIKPRECGLGAACADQIDAGEQRGVCVRLVVFLMQLEALSERGRGVGVLPRRLERKPEVEIPFCLVGIERQRTAKLADRLVPATRVVVLVGTLDMLLCINPVVHGKSVPQGPGCASCISYTKMGLVFKVSRRTLTISSTFCRFQDRESCHGHQKECMQSPKESITIARRTLWVITIPGICLAACANSPATTTPQPAEPLQVSHESTQPSTQTYTEQSAPHSAEPPAETSETTPEPETQIAPPKTATESSTAPIPAAASRTESTATVDELLALYRRLHTVLNAHDRSDLITELLSDPRRPVLELGFELAHRNLSSRITLSPSVGGATVALLTSPDPAIRGSAAGLLTRLVTPDAMLRLTESLNQEDVPGAAEPMLLGVARWPNKDATASVVRWCIRADSPINAATTAAWAFEQAGLLNNENDRSALLGVLRTQAGDKLQLPALKLLATLGDASDLQSLAAMLTSTDKSIRDRVAAALVETPRATELIVQAAEVDPDLYASASEALIRHRASPAGMRRLALLTPPSPADRSAALDRMSETIDIDSLSEAVSVAGLNDQTAMKLLQRLLTVESPRSPRVARGLVMLAELDLRQGLGIEALDIADSLSGDSLDPADRTKLLSIQQRSAVLAGLLTHPSLDSMDAQRWFEFFDAAGNDDARRALRAQIRKRFADSLSQEQTARLSVDDAPAVPDSE